MSSLNVDVNNLPKQNEILPIDMPDEFSAKVLTANEHTTKRNKLNVVYAVEVTKPRKYVGQVFDVYHGWGERVVAGSGYALAVHLLREAGITNPLEVVGKEVVFKKIPITEAPNFRPSSNPDFEGEKYPKYYVIGYVE